MLPTFVIGLREGLEAALIVGIIAAFLRKQGRRDRLRQVWLGVLAAVVLCVLVGIGLETFSRDLPQRQQEGLETVIGVLAVCIVTYMVVWMKEHSRGLKQQLESMAAEALDSAGSRAGAAMVVMAFLAVLREGFETVVFLMAAFNETGAVTSAVAGAVLGIAVAVLLGWGIYRGGVRINLSRFFRATGLVLVLVAGGLVVSALHTAHEAGWLQFGQHRMLDLTWLVQPGSVLSSLLTGMLGIQPYPVLIEVLGWLLYVIPVGIFVAWPPGRKVPLGRARLITGAVAAAGLAAAAVLAWTAPTVTVPAVATTGNGGTRVVSVHGDKLIVSTPAHSPLQGTTGPAKRYTLGSTGSTTVDGLAAQTYQAPVAQPATRSGTLSTTRIAKLNGGRLPIGVRPTATTVPVRHQQVTRLTVAVEPRTQRVLTEAWRGTDRITVAGSSGQQIAVQHPLRTASDELPAATTHAATAAARTDLAHLDTRTGRVALARFLGVLGGASLLGFLVTFGARRKESAAPAVTDPTTMLIKT